MIIRSATLHDAPGVRACARAAYVQYVAAIGREPMPMIADFDGQIAQGIVTVAADTQNAITGFIVFFPRDTDMFLENVAVLPNAGGQGIGKALIAHCEAEARRLGLPAVQLYTNEKMTGNQTLYPHLGYHEIFRRTEHGFHRIYYEKRLNP